MQRRLAAILVADVVGYSRLVEKDEGRTLSALPTLQTALLQPQIAAHAGRIVKLMGDGIGGFIFGLVRVRTGQLAGATAAHWLLDGVLMLAIRVLGLVRTTT